MATLSDLEYELRRIDGRGYRAYKDVAGAYHTSSLSLFIDHVQGDPFAAPSLIRVRIPMSEADIPEALFENRVRRIGLEDFLARQVRSAIRRLGEGHRGSGKSGIVSVDAGGQEVLERTAVVVTAERVEVRLQAGLPAAGRRVLGRQAAAMLCEEVPEIARRGLCWRNLSHNDVERHVVCFENQETIRRQLEARRLVAFVADGSILPRESGASDRPMRDAVPFRSPDSLRTTFELPNPWKGDQKTISGMGIRQGVNLIVGGGYHGKSTLLQAIQNGVYGHIPGDGREYVVTDEGAVKIRAEDGRRVACVDISAFINHLPHGLDTTRFSTEDASGSTSQAANIAEAVEAGATSLLVDEDTSATNFMMRDARMQALIDKSSEPITPFIERIRELHRDHGVSTVLVLGGCGDYIDVADNIIMMKEYLPIDVTESAREVAARFPSVRKVEVSGKGAFVNQRVPVPDSLDPSKGRRDVKIDARGVDQVIFGTEDIDLHSVEQIVDKSQTRAIGLALYLAREEFMRKGMTVAEILEALDRRFESAGLDGLAPFVRQGRHPGNLARPRRFEVAAALNRLRSLGIRG